MTPMFVETLNSQAQESVASQAGTMKGKLRATQTSLEFSQTQTTGILLHQGRRSRSCFCRTNDIFVRTSIRAESCAPVKGDVGVWVALL